MIKFSPSVEQLGNLIPKRPLLVAAGAGGLIALGACSPGVANGLPVAEDRDAFYVEETSFTCDNSVPPDVLTVVWDKKTGAPLKATVRVDAVGLGHSYLVNPEGEDIDENAKFKDAVAVTSDRPKEWTFAGTKSGDKVKFDNTAGFGGIGCDKTLEAVEDKAAYEDQFVSEVGTCDLTDKKQGLDIQAGITGRVVDGEAVEVTVDLKGPNRIGKMAISVDLPDAKVVPDKDNPPATVEKNGKSVDNFFKPRVLKYVVTAPNYKNELEVGLDLQAITTTKKPTVEPMICAAVTNVVPERP